MRANRSTCRGNRSTVVRRLNCGKAKHSSHKLSLVGIQLPEKYKENLDVLSEGPSLRVSSGSRTNYMSFYTKNIKARSLTSDDRRAFARNVEILLVFFR